MATHRLATIVVALSLAASACSFSASVGSKAVSPSELEKQVAAKLTELNLTPTAVDCPQGLKAEVEATATCGVIANGLKYTAAVTATAVKDSKVSFNLKVPPPAIVPSKTLEAQVEQQLAGQIKPAIDRVVCPDDLEGTKGATVECTVTDTRERNLQMVLTVTKADFLGVNFSIDQQGMIQ